MQIKDNSDLVAANPLLAEDMFTDLINYDMSTMKKEHFL